MCHILAPCDHVRPDVIARRVGELAPQEGIEPPTTRLFKAALYPLSYRGMGGGISLRVEKEGIEPSSIACNRSVAYCGHTLQIDQAVFYFRMTIGANQDAFVKLLNHALPCAHLADCKLFQLSI